MARTILPRHELRAARHRRSGRHHCRPGQVATMRVDHRRPLHHRRRPPRTAPARRLVAAVAMLLIVSFTSVSATAGGWSA